MPYLLVQYTYSPPSAKARDQARPRHRSWVADQLITGAVISSGPVAEGADTNDFGGGDAPHRDQRCGGANAPASSGGRRLRGRGDVESHEMLDQSKGDPCAQQ